MVTRALFVVLALASSAIAEKRVSCLTGEGTLPHRGPQTTWSRLGTRVAWGFLSIDDQPMTTMSLAVAIDRPLAGEWRALVEYEYLWIGPTDWDAHNNVGVASLPDSGHRAHLGLRRELVEGQWAYGRVRGFVDAEAGGGAMLVDRMTGSSLAVPHAFAGVRAGLSFVQHRSRWDYELVVRGLATPEGAGVVAGIGLVWGD